MPAPPPRHLVERLSAPGPKRILSLDGGGIRGLITLGYLRRLEGILRERSGNSELVLADYFDLIGGTSTGALIAASLSVGWSVDKVVGLYHTLAADVFRPKRSLLGPLARLVGAKFDERPLERAIREQIGDMRIDDAAFRCGLVVLAKRADTASVWQLTNVPGHRFYEMNRHLPLWEILRASSAAPTYFTPQRMRDVGGGESAVFVDGSVSMHANPALQMFMVACLEGFGLQWAPGEHSILLCSIGTGAHDVAPPADSIRGYRQVQWLGTLMVQLIRDASELGETLLQWMSSSPTARPIDLQLGDLGRDQLAPEPLLTYLRYDVRLTPEGLAAIGQEVAPGELAGLRALDGYEHVEQLENIGTAAAALQLQASHFPTVFDIDPAGPSDPAGPTTPSTPGVVAVTGHREGGLGRADLSLLASRIDAVLAVLRCRGYGVVVTGLAEGADRLVAHRALAADWTLHSVLPFEADRYEADFLGADSRAEFRRLRARSAEVVVVADEGESGNANGSTAYAAVGRRLVSVADVVVAIWDGEHARGPGGTGDVVASALEARRPVIWIHSEPPHPIRYADMVSVEGPCEAPFERSLGPWLDAGVGVRSP